MVLSVSGKMHCFLNHDLHPTIYHMAQVEENSHPVEPPIQLGEPPTQQEELPIQQVEPLTLQGEPPDVPSKSPLIDLQNAWNSRDHAAHGSLHDTCMAECTVSGLIFTISYKYGYNDFWYIVYFVLSRAQCPVICVGHYLLWLNLQELVDLSLVSSWYGTFVVFKFLM